MLSIMSLHAGSIGVCRCQQVFATNLGGGGLVADLLATIHTKFGVYCNAIG